ncbi:MAG: lytic transglycosylase [Alphaproteobacteria bacterium]|nr:MAG: lytic transglycosylase [Alphaproteobacteria bacterium]
MPFRLTTLGAAMIALATIATTPALAAKCGNNSAGFGKWVEEFRQEAVANGIKPATLNLAFADIHYNTKTIWADRNQKSFKLSYEEFLKRRGAAAIISQGRKHKERNAALFDRIEARYGVPAGPLIAIWGMETAFGSFQGDQSVISALATLAYDCRRSAFFEEQLYAALGLLQSGQLTMAEMTGARHGELGQMQFLPSNYVKFGVDADGDGRVDMIRSRADALASTANYLRAHGWKPGLGYQPGEPNFDALAEWNKAQVYQRALAYIGAEIDR